VKSFAIEYNVAKKNYLRDFVIFYNLEKLKVNVISIFKKMQKLKNCVVSKYIVKNIFVAMLNFFKCLINVFNVFNVLMFLIIIFVYIFIILSFFMNIFFKEIKRFATYLRVFLFNCN